uniref:Retrotransposon gag domain-containing protein n=1 Tax=Trichuris muris TaxID=70415 RepID=A0A5S6QR15_TRIMR
MCETRRHKAEEAVAVDGACPGGDGGKGEGQRCGVVDQRMPSAGASERSSRPWFRPPPCFPPGMDVDIWLNRLNDYLEANNVPEAKWMAVLKSFVDDEVYSALAEERPMATFGGLTTCLQRRYGVSAQRNRWTTSRTNCASWEDRQQEATLTCTDNLQRNLRPGSASQHDEG